MQQTENAIKALKQARKQKKQQPEQEKKKGLKRLSDEVLDRLTDEPVPRQPEKRQKLSKNRERKIQVTPSTSMFSPGKDQPAHLEVAEGYVPLSSAGSTTQFGVVNLSKARAAGGKKSTATIAALNFREKMLARNPRQPMTMYLMHLNKQMAKSTFRD